MLDFFKTIAAIIIIACAVVQKLAWLGIGIGIIMVIFPAISNIGGMTIIGWSLFSLILAIIIQFFSAAILQG